MNQELKDLFSKLVEKESELETTRTEIAQLAGSILSKNWVGENLSSEQIATLLSFSVNGSQKDWRNNTHKVWEFLASFTTGMHVVILSTRHIPVRQVFAPTPRHDNTYRPQVERMIYFQCAGQPKLEMNPTGSINLVFPPCRSIMSPGRGEKENVQSVKALTFSLTKYCTDLESILSSTPIIAEVIFSKNDTASIPVCYKGNLSQPTSGYILGWNRINEEEIVKTSLYPIDGKDLLLQLKKQLQEQLL